MRGIDAAAIDVIAFASVLTVPRDEERCLKSILGLQLCGEVSYPRAA